MSFKCPAAPANKKEYISDVGRILVNNYGQKKFYKPEEVKKASSKSKHYKTNGIDWHCWAMCTFSSHADFDAFHKITGELCDYVEMKTVMLNGLSTSTITDWTEIPDVDIDASWLDFGDVFEGMLTGIGDFVSGIFDGI